MSNYIEDICEKYAGKQPPTLLINDFDLNATYYQQLRWLAEKINMNLSIIGQASIVDNSNYLIFNNNISLPKEFQFKRCIYGNQIRASTHNMSHPDLGIYVWQAQLFDKMHLAGEFYHKTQNNFPLIMALDDVDAAMIRVDTPESGLSILTNYSQEQVSISVYPYINVHKRRKLLLIEDTIIAVLESYPFTNDGNDIFSSVHYLSGDILDITTQELQAINVLVERLEYHAGWMIEYFIDINKNIHIINLDNGYDLSAFMDISSQPVLFYMFSKLIEQYFDNKLQTVLLNNIYLLENSYQRFNLIAAYHLDIGIEPVDGSLETARLSYSNRRHIVSRCAFGAEALSTPFKNKYYSKKKFQQKLLKKHPEVVIPTIYLSNKINYSISKIEKLISTWSFPMVLKPDEGISCDNLFIDLHSAQDILDAHQQILRSQYKGSLLQPRLNGVEYRVVLVDQSVVAIAKKLAAQLRGDGHSTIQELIQQYNDHYKHYINDACNNVANNFNIKLHADKPDFRTIPNIKINEEFITFLARQELVLESILAKDTTLDLLHVNINGATWENAWTKIDEELLEKIRKIHIEVGMKINGADVLIINNNELKIFEFNCFPGIMFHHFILNGKPEPVIQSVYNYLFKMH